MPIQKLTKAVEYEETVGYRLDLTLEETAALVLLVRTISGDPVDSPRALFQSIANKLPTLQDARIATALPTESFGYGRAFFKDWDSRSKAEFAAQVNRLR